MANPETTTGTTVPKSVEEDTSQPTETTSATEASPAARSSFVERMSGIPVIDAALKYSTSAYKQVKEYNPITSYALTKAEETAVFLACTAVPYVKKIEPQVKAVDDLACRGLDLVEEKLPILTRPPEEILSETRKLCASTMQTGYQKVEEMKSLGTEAVAKAKSYGVQKGTEALGECLSRTEGLVDKYLPPVDNEQSADAPSLQGLSVTERATNLTSKVGNRVYSHGLIQVQRIHSYGQEATDKLAYTIDLVKYLRDNYSTEKLLNYMDDAKIKASWIWEELHKEEPLEAAEAEKSVERRLISLARRLTGQIVHTYEVAAASVKEVPQKTYQENLAAARNYAAELFTQLDKAIEKNEITGPMLQMVHEKVEALQNLAKSVVSSAPSQEMVEMVPISKDDVAKPEDAGASG